MRLKKFNVNSEQHKLNKKINLTNNIKVRTVILSIFVLVGSVMLFTYSKYNTTIKLDVMHSKVEELKIINYYIDDILTNNPPEKNSGYVATNIVCDNNTTGEWDDDEWELVIESFKAKSECSVYFEEFEYSEDFDYTGNVQTFIVPKTGNYKIELWGASGRQNDAGTGAYTKGNILLTKNDVLYFYIGQGTGVNPNYVVDKYYQFNGGGCGEASGGGATDVRIIDGDWNNFDSLKSRIMVAAGGGGGFINATVNQKGFAGGLTGYDAKSNYSSYSGKGSTQTVGGDGGIEYCPSYWGHTCYFQNKNGKFGMGGYTYNVVIDSLNEITRASGGGGGYYGGGAGTHPGGSHPGGGGGSSFISGHSGCNAINYASSTSPTSIIHTNQSVLTINDKSYIFSDTEMIDGKGCRWTTSVQSPCNGQIQPDGSSATGHVGNGYARITYIN